MASARITSTPTHEQLTVLLDRLSDVMLEAERLRTQISRQLLEQRHSQQQQISPVRRKAAGKRAKPSRKRR